MIKVKNFTKARYRPCCKRCEHNDRNLNSAQFIVAINTCTKRGAEVDDFDVCDNYK